MLLFLIGLPGSGKTTLGKELATLLGIHFLDLDHEIVSRYKLSIEEIFEKKGEAAFREMERDTLHSLSQDASIIVATGGGAACFHNNMEWMNTHGITLYINPPLEELSSRLSLSKSNHRPMLKGFSKEDTLKFLEQKKADRELYYLQAKLKMPATSPKVGDLKKLLESEGITL